MTLLLATSYKSFYNSYITVNLFRDVKLYLQITSEQ